MSQISKATSQPKLSTDPSSTSTSSTSSKEREYNWKIHDVYHSIIPFVPHNVRRGLATVSKTWSKSVQEFPSKLILKMRQTMLDIDYEYYWRPEDDEDPASALVRSPVSEFLPPISILDHIDLFPKDHEFLKTVCKTLKQLAQIPTGEKLLFALSKISKPLTIARCSIDRAINRGDEDLVLFNPDSSTREFLVIYRSTLTGELYFDILPQVAALGHELIHILHHREKRALPDRIICDPYFLTSEEMLTVYGCAPTQSRIKETPMITLEDPMNEIVRDPINERVLLKELHHDMRISHAGFSRYDLDYLVAYGIDGEFRKRLEEGLSLTEPELEHYMSMAITNAFGERLILPQFGSCRMLQGNHFEMIRLLLQAGCRKEVVFAQIGSYLAGGRHIETEAFLRIKQIVNSIPDCSTEASDTSL